jgi:hypothetical protein
VFARNISSSITRLQALSEKVGNEPLRLNVAAATSGASQLEVDRLVEALRLANSRLQEVRDRFNFLYFAL